MYSTNNKRYLSILFIVILIIGFLLNISGLEKLGSFNIVVALGLNLFIVIIALFYFGLDFISYLLMCINSLLLPLVVQYFTNNSYGVLALNIVPLHMADVMIFTFEYCALLLFLSIVFNFKYSEHQMIISEGNIKIENLNILFNNCVAIIFTIVAFPRLSLSVNGGERFDMLLPGHAWNQLAIVALLFNLPVLKKSKSVKITYLFVILWFLFNGERADITGLVLGLIVYNFMSQGKTNRAKKVKLTIVAILFVLILVFIGIIRNKNELSFEKLISLLVSTQTTSDVAYLYNCSIDAFKKGVVLKSRIFLQDFRMMMPLSNAEDFSDIIQKLGYFSPGGEPFLSQSILDWGSLGPVFRAILDFIIFKLFTLNKNSGLLKMEFLLLICSVPRLTWYGRNYLFTSIIFFVPLMYWLNTQIKTVKLSWS